MTIDHTDTVWISLSYSDTLFLRIGSDAYVSGAKWDVVPSGLLPKITGQVQVPACCADSKNNIYFAVPTIPNGNPGNRILRYLASGTVELFAGSGNVGSADGNGLFTSFKDPTALAVDLADNIYVWDSGNHLIRRISQSRDVVTIAGRESSQVDVDGHGTNASFASVTAMCVDGAGNLILACGSSIRKLTVTTNVTTLAGSFIQGAYTNGTGDLARFGYAAGVCISQDGIFVADTGNQRIRRITLSPQPDPVSDANLTLNTYPGLRINGIVGRTYQIESSSDTAVWTAEKKILLTHTPYLWIDPEPLGSKKFYRAALLP